MSWLDILVIIIFGICILFGMWRGFIRTVLGFANFIIAILLTNMLYPHMGRFLRSIDGLFDTLTQSVKSGLGLDAAIYAESQAAQLEIINSLPIPAAFRDTLIENNVPIIYNALGAVGFADYVAGFLAGIIINIISMVIVFILIFAGLSILARLLNIVAKLPVINTLNKLLGAAVGAIWGLLLTWLVLGVVVIYLSANTAVDVAQMLDSSAIAGPLHESNFALRFILRLFP